MPDEPRQQHWNTVYATKGLTEVSWYEPVPARSLELIRATGADPADPIIDVGGGASFLAEALLQEGYRDLTVLDVSSEALQKLRERLGEKAVTLVEADVTEFQPARRYALWHDRAVFHFLVQPEDRERYVRVLRRALRPDGHVVLATFGPAGPQRCSGLPVKRYDEVSLGEELGEEFRLGVSSLAVHRTPSGGEQQFLYCLFRRAAAAAPASKA